MSSKNRWDPLDGYRAQPRGRWTTFKRVAGAIAGLAIALLLGTAMILAIERAFMQ
jgi:hypothetical protein